jgi:hypothetical protein
MKIRYDHKGKYYTQFESKNEIEALIQTQNQRIQGRIHIHPDHRLLDELNTSPPFLAVTEARILQSEIPLKTDFIAIQKCSILWVVPIEEINEGPIHGHYRS